MTQTAPPDQDSTPSGEDRPDVESPRTAHWKQAVVAVTSTVADAAFDAVTIVGDAARALTGRPAGAPRGVTSRRLGRAGHAAGEESKPDLTHQNGSSTPAMPSAPTRSAPAADASAGTTAPLSLVVEPHDGSGAAALSTPTDDKATTAADDATAADDVKTTEETAEDATTTDDVKTTEETAEDATTTDDVEDTAAADVPPGPADADAARPGQADTVRPTSTAAVTPTETSDTAHSPTSPVGGDVATATASSDFAAEPDGSASGRTAPFASGHNGAGPDTGHGTAQAVIVAAPPDVDRPTETPDHDDASTTQTVTAPAALAPVPPPGRTYVPAWMPKLRRRPDRERPWLLRAATFAVVSLAGLALIIVAAAALLPRALAFATDSAEAELILPADTAFDPLAQRTRVLYANGSLLAILHGEEDRKPVHIDKMPDHAWQAVVAAEDKNFFDHEGYDPAGIGRALLANFQAGGVEQGGSTISQQVARLNFKEVGLDRSVERKLKEVAYAIALEERFTKKDILNRYVNQVYFGSGAYGLQAASEEFFDRDVTKIRPDQAATLAGLISSPTAYNPRSNPEVAREQRDLVLDSMAEAGFLTEQEATESKARKLKVAPPPEGTNRQPSILEEVMREVKANPVFGATVAEREDNLFNGGLRIRTTISPKLQKIAQRTIESRYPSGGGDGITAAIATVDPRTGEIKAAASARRYNKQNFNLAIRGRRQPGSAFKPFVMAEALRQGFSPGTTLDARSPIVFPQRYGPSWTVSNYGGASYGQIDMATATRKSVNTYFAQLIQLVGVEKAVNLAEKLGLSRDGIGQPGFYGPAIVLGGLRNGATPLEMASAYGTFANNGVHVEPHLISEVKRGKELLYEYEPRKTKVLSPQVNATALRLLRGPPSSGGTAPYVSGSVYPWPVAGKTGTTQLATDAWFVGTTPVLSTAVWVGYKNSQVRMYGATGGGYAAPVWQQFMQGALAPRKPRGFPSVSEAEFVGKAVNVPNVVGLSAQDALAKLAKRKLIGRAQYQASAAPAGSVLWVSPSDSAQIGTTVYVGVSTGVPPPPPEPEQPSEDSKPKRKKENRGRGNSGGGNN